MKDDQAKNAANDNDKPKIIRHGIHEWVHDRIALDQGAYYLAEPSGKKFAVILPVDRSRPIDIPEANAKLCLRGFGSTEWNIRGPLTLMEGLVEGSRHADRYFARWLTRQMGRSNQRDHDKDRGRDFER